jgi:RpiR family carbohydrate utilization transcriptional regulator
MPHKNNVARAVQAPVDLEASIRNLSRGRQELIRPVLENPGEYVLLTTRGLAQKLGVDPATASRVVLRMGFASYRNFQRYLHELSVSQVTSLDTMRASKAKGSKLSAHVRETIENNQRNLQRLQNTLDFERVAALAKRMYEAKRIFVFGGDLASNLVGYLQYALFFLGMSVLAGTSAGDTAHLSRSAGDRDLVIAISYRRGLRQTVEGLKLAKANGTYCVGITDTLVSPIARFAHECFITSVESPSFGASYVAPMCLLEGIVAACSYYPNESAQALLRKQAEEQRLGFRWYRD